MSEAWLHEETKKGQSGGGVCVIQKKKRMRARTVLTGQYREATCIDGTTLYPE